MDAPHVHLQHKLEGRLGILVLGGGVVHVFDFADLGPAGFRVHQHGGSVKAVPAHGEVRGIVRQGIVHLEPGDAQGHGHVGHGVALGEHVLDLLAAVDEPGGHVMVQHGLLHLGLEALALADRLHGGEGQLRLHALVNEVVHDVVTAADAFVQLGGAGADDILGVAQPHVRAVAQAGDADQLLHGGGLGVVQHAPHEGRAKFGNAEGAGGAVNLFRGNAQGLRGVEQAAHGGVIQGNVPEVDARQAAQLVDHGGVIMAQAVQLHQDVVHGVEVEVGGDELAVQVVGGMLHGGELVDFVFLGHHHHARGVLACGALDTHAALHQALFLRVAALDAPLLQVLAHVAIGGLVRQGAHGAGPEHMPLAEELHHLVVGLGLVFPGEVQVDVGHLIPGEAQEHLEGDVEAVLYQGASAQGAILVRQVHAHLVLALVHVEKALVAMGAAVMGRQGVHLGDAAHAGHEAGAHGTAAAHQVSVIQGALHQPLGNVVQRGKAVADNGAQLLFQALDHNVRQGIAIPVLGRAPGHVLNVVRGIGPEGLEGILALGVLGEQAQSLHLVGNLAGIGNNHLPGLFLPQVGEFLQHLVGGFEVQWRLLVAVLITQARLDNGAVDGVVGVQEVHVPRGHHRNAQLLPQADNGAVQLPQSLVVGHLPLPHQEGIVADGLNLQVIVEPGDLLELVQLSPASTARKSSPASQALPTMSPSRYFWMKRRGMWGRRRK